MFDLTSRNDIWLEDIKIVGTDASIIWTKLECHYDENRNIVFEDLSGKIYFTATNPHDLVMSETMNNVVNENPYALRDLVLQLIVEQGRGAFGYKDMDILINIGECIKFRVESSDEEICYSLDTEITYDLLEEVYQILAEAPVSKEYASGLIYDILKETEDGSKLFEYETIPMSSNCLMINYNGEYLIISLEEEDTSIMVEYLPWFVEIFKPLLKTLNHESKSNKIYYEEYRDAVRSSRKRLAKDIASLSYIKPPGFTLEELETRPDIKKKFDEVGITDIETINKVKFLSKSYRR